VGAQELALARETIDRLATPWDRLFGALESAASDKVALLGLEPDAKAGTVTISGDSKDYLAVLSYVLNLSQTNALGRVQLVRHEVKSSEPQRPVSFVVSAGWGESRP
jgi:Tfp pilus assembly protein PilN